MDFITLSLYKEIFSIVDFTECGRIGRDEVHFGLEVSGINLSDEDFNDMFHKVDRDGSGQIDFSEFLEFMFDLRLQLTEHEEDEYTKDGKAAQDRKKKKSGGQKRRQFAMIGASAKMSEEQVMHDNPLSPSPPSLVSRHIHVLVTHILTYTFQYSIFHIYIHIHIMYKMTRRQD